MGNVASRFLCWVICFCAPPRLSTVITSGLVPITYRVFYGSLLLTDGLTSHYEVYFYFMFYVVVLSFSTYYTVMSRLRYLV